MKDTIIRVETRAGGELEENRKFHNEPSAWSYAEQQLFTPGDVTVRVVFRALGREGGRRAHQNQGYRGE